MQATHELIAASVPEKHPSGTRRRGGYEFTTTPSVALVSPEGKATIKADPYIKVHRRLSLAWFAAFRVERTEKNEKKYAEKDPEDWQETAQLARRTGDPLPDTATEVKAPEKPTQSQGAKEEAKKDTAAPVNNFSSKDTIVKALESLGLKAGTDFDPDATRKVLLALHNEKAAKQKADEVEGK